MKILVYGAGPLGSIFAARLHAAGHAVRLLARGRRFEELRQYGVVITDVISNQTTVTQVPLVERLDPQDDYDLVLVVMRKNRLSEALPALAANANTPNILFLMNNAAGPSEMTAALGAARVMLGFPTSGGYRDGHIIRALAGAADDPATIPIGEIDGRTQPRTEQVAEALRSMEGYKVEIRNDMDAWLRTHVALLMPSIAPAFYAAGSNLERLAKTRDLLVLTVRAVREGFHVLRETGFPITPRRLRQFEWLPEPVLVAFLQRLLARPEMETALAGHARAAPDEIRHLVGEFLALRAKTNVETPAINALLPYLDPGEEEAPMQEGSAAIAMDWTGLWVGVTALATVVGGIFLVGGLLVHRSRKGKSEEKQ
jgi:2-dehydropantoate 2-reductase